MFCWKNVFVAVVALVVVSPLSAQKPDPHVGMWKQNFDKSTITPAPTSPRPQSISRTYEMFSDGLKATLVTISADGARTETTYSAHFDGKDVPFKGANSDTIALKKVNARTFESTIKKDGKVVQTVTNEVSADGKTMTVTGKGTNANGQPVSSVAVFEKQ